MHVPGEFDFVATPTDTENVGPAAGQYTWYLPQLAQQWVNHSQNAYGLELEASDEASTNELSFKSGQDPNQGNRPTLDIEYEPWYAEPTSLLDWDSTTTTFGYDANHHRTT